MKSLTAFILTANLAVIALLAFALPHQMISPGRLIDGHQQFANDCFACHAPLRGTPPAKCESCHEVDKIGLFTTRGEPILDRKSRTAFHRRLKEQNCVACHSDHQGVLKFRPQRHFAHALLDPATREQCDGCHRKPADTLHNKLSGNCSQCHTTEAWKPATFDHDRYFVLDRDHNVECATCHARNDYRSYTCYGCHEHSKTKMWYEHAEENIRNLDDCVRCHRSSSEHGEGGEHGERGFRGEDDD